MEVVVQTYVLTQLTTTDVNALINIIYLKMVLFVYKVILYLHQCTNARNMYYRHNNIGI